MEPCIKEKVIDNLVFNQDKFMEILNEVRGDVKEIKKFIFEWWMAKNYITKEVFDLMMSDKDNTIAEIQKSSLERIKKLENNQNKLAWIIITAVILAVLAIIIKPTLI